MIEQGGSIFIKLYKWRQQGKDHTKKNLSSDIVKQVQYKILYQSRLKMTKLVQDNLFCSVNIKGSYSHRGWTRKQTQITIKTNERPFANSKQ